MSRPVKQSASTLKDWNKVPNADYINVRVFKQYYENARNEFKILLVTPTSFEIFDWLDVSDPKSVISNEIKEQAEDALTKLVKVCGFKPGGPYPEFFFDRYQKWVANIAEISSSDVKYSQLCGSINLMMTEKDCIEFKKLLASIKWNIIKK